MNEIAREILEKRSGEPAREKVRRLFGKGGLTEDWKMADIEFASQLPDLFLQDD